MSLGNFEKACFQKTPRSILVLTVVLVDIDTIGTNYCLYLPKAELITKNSSKRRVIDIQLLRGVEEFVLNKYL